MLSKIAKYTLAAHAVLAAVLLIDSNLIGIKLFGGEVGVATFWFAMFYGWAVLPLAALACIVADWFRIKGAAK